MFLRIGKAVVNSDHLVSISTDGSHLNVISVGQTHMMKIDCETEEKAGEYLLVLADRLSGVK